MTEQRLVGRVYTDKEAARCIDCKEPFKFGVNIFTKEGQLEVGISGTCEKCFDSYFGESDD